MFTYYLQYMICYYVLEYYLVLYNLHGARKQTKSLHTPCDDRRVRGNHVRQVRQPERSAALAEQVTIRLHQRKRKSQGQQRKEDRVKEAAAAQRRKGGNVPEAVCASKDQALYKIPVSLPCWECFDLHQAPVRFRKVFHYAPHGRVKSKP